MSAQEQSEQVQLAHKLLLEALEHLEVIVPSLDRIGSSTHGMPESEQMRILFDFVVNWSVMQRLARIRQILSEAISYSEWETLFEDLEVWSLDHRNPAGPK